MSNLPAPFIVGVERSGTTLLRMMLDSHPDIAIPYETFFIRKIVQGAWPELTRDQFFEIVTGHPSWRNLALPNDVLMQGLEALKVFSVSEAIRTFYRLYAARNGKKRWGDKTPFYLDCMTEIRDLLPEAHFIHIIRDGRDTALSFRGLWFGPGSDIEDAARHWVKKITDARAQSLHLPHYLEVQYEKLVREPSFVLEKISTCLQIDYNPEMLHYYRHARDRLAEIVQPFGFTGGDKLAIDEFKSIYAHTTVPPDQNRIGRWKQEMSFDDRRRFEQIGGYLLAELGYEI